MARTKGAKNKPKDVLNYENLGDILSPQLASQWLRVSRNEIMRQIYAKEIPADCYFKVGSHYKIIKNKLALLIGIKERTIA